MSTTLSRKFKFLEEIGTLPVLVSTGLQFLGVKEIPGAQSNPVILQMAKSLGIEKIYTNDDTSWCGLFMSYLFFLTGKPFPDLKGDQYNYLRAAWFLGYGNEVQKGSEMLGDVCIFKRPGGNHVGLIIAESEKTFFVLGGNQSNSVNIAEISKSRLLQCRRLYRTSVPSSVKKYTLSTTGTVSTNEA